MRLLLDSNVLLWALGGDDRLGSEARARIADPASVVWVSAATVWELEIKRARGRLRLPADLAAAVRERGGRELAVSFEHGAEAARLPPHHRDPFDRMLVAQARAESLVLVTGDAELGRYDVRILSARD